MLTTVLRKLPVKPAIEALVVTILTSLALVLAGDAIVRDRARPDHEVVMRSLRSIDLDYASLQRDVLRARVGVLASYASLQSSVYSLRKRAAVLREVLIAASSQPDQLLDSRLRELEGEIPLTKKAVEDFEASNMLRSERG